MTDSGLYTVEDGWVETYTGVAFYFNKPTVEMIKLADVAHALAYLCRYNGHSKHFYSVAEHSYHMAQWLLDEGYSVKTALTGLLHDVAEAYIGDMPRPIKVTMPNFKAMEARIEAVAKDRFDIIYPFPHIIKQLDSRILNDERGQVMQKSEHEWGTDSLEPLGVEIQFWDPFYAESQFLSMAYKLGVKDDE